MKRIRKRILKWYLKQLLVDGDISDKENEAIQIILKNKLLFDAIYVDALTIFEENYIYERKSVVFVEKFIEWIYENQTEILRLVLLVVSLLGDEDEHEPRKEK